MQQSAGTYEEYLLKSYVGQMSNQHTNTALSWRKLYLSRAKLKASSRTSALLSGFAMVAMVEIQWDARVPDALLVVFGISTTLLVSVHLLALMISTCILPNIESVSNVHNVNAVNESPHEKMKWYIELSWICSTGLGILLFLSEIAVLCWVKFYDRKSAAIASTVVVIPAGLLFIVFSLIFYHKLMAHKYERHTEGLRELECLAHTIQHNSLNSNTLQTV